MASDLKELKAKKANLKRQLTRFNKFVTPLVTEAPSDSIISQLKLRLENIEPTFACFDDIQCKIECSDVNTESQEALEQERNKFETEYYETISQARTLLANYYATANQKHNELSTVTIPETNSAIKLPTIQIPNFNGSYDTWFNFHDTYKSLIHSNTTLAPIQKFHYLKSSLTGEAANVIQALEITEQNYLVAWKLLVERYENKKIIIQKHVKALFNMPTISKESANDIRTLIDTVQKHLRALEALEEPTKHWDTLVIHLITSKCDKYTLKEWETRSQNTEKPLLNDLISFLNSKCQVLEVINKDVPLSNKIIISKPRAINLVAQTASCPHCKGKHNLYQCEQFLKSSIEERKELAKKLKVCYNCLRNNHRQTDCRAGSCRQCEKKHHTLLCNDKKNIPVKNNASENNEDNSKNGNYSVVANMASIDTLKQTLLSTAIVKVIDHSGHLHSARALLDPASHCNFISETFCKKLNCKTKRIAVPISGIGQLEARTNQITSLVIKSSYNAYKQQLNCLVLPRITDNLPTEDFDDKSWNIPETIKLADSTYNKSAPVELLLGAEIFWDLLCVGQIKLGPNLPLLHKTKLGWIVGGPLPCNQGKTKQVCNLSLQQVGNQLRQFWEIEDILSQKTLLSKDEDACVEIFEKTTIRADDGKFIVRLPLKMKREALGSSENTAMKRFQQIERKLARNESLRKSYAEFMNEYEKLEHMKEIPIQDARSDKVAYYIPHHAVVKSSSLTTKTRVVFDASAKTDNDVSLNEIMLVGPQLQPELFNIVIQFRTHKIALIADIEKMYRMIWVHPEDRALQQIFWRSSPEEEIKAYQLQTLTYGTAAASFIAAKALYEIAEREKTEYPMLENIIKECFYMDDLISGTETVDEALELKANLDKVFRSYGFKLRKWCSNNEEIRKSANNNDNEFEIIDISRENTIKTLGLIWNPSNDCFQYAVKDNIKEERITKRNILSNIARIFDPLGLLGPVIMIAKLILQQLWQEGLQWDETPSTSIYTQWNQFRNQVSELNDLKIERNVIPITKPHTIQIHGFCDASEKAYGACLYVRTINETEAICHLLCSKSRVAPLKRISLPRLELCGALLLSQLYKKVTTHLKLACETFLWTDSTIVLAWINGQPNQWQVFVGNRVSQIQAATKTADWRHVRSNENPADTLSRGLQPINLKQKNLWWHGPHWLSELTASFPPYSNEATEVPEQRNIKLVGMVSTVHLTFLNKFSNFVKMLRVIAYCLRYIHNLKKRVNDKEKIKLELRKVKQGELVIDNITVEELILSEMAIVKSVQHEFYHREINDIKLNGTIGNSSKLLTLKPFLDSNELLRVGGRLTNADLTEDQKFPIILPSNHHLVKLMVRYYHERLLHAGNQAVLYTMRKKYWPINGRSTVRKYTKTCVQCFKCKPVEGVTQMGDLPGVRVKPAKPFYNSGTDYAGPIYIKTGTRKSKSVNKAYICLFICLATKAVHIEVVTDLTTTAFLAAIKRFIARRGQIANIYSDNATTYIGADRELRELGQLMQKKDFQNEVINELGNNLIQWHFIPPRAPNFGGLWEAAIKSTKHHLKRIVGNSTLTYEELCTLLCQIECCLNSRPLCPLSNDPADINPLTPGHFITGDSLMAIPERDLQDVPINRLSRWQHLQYMYQHFWKRWSLEYLNQLQERTKWKKKGNIKFAIGDLVILKDENLPPLKWNLGRIIRLHPGKDGEVRVFDVKTKNGEVKRSVTKLCRLPIDTESTEV